MSKIPKNTFNIDNVLNYLLKRRMALSLTQGDLAERIGLSANSRAIIHRIEQGTRTISLEEFVDICRALRLDPWRLLKDEAIIIPVTSKDYEDELVFMKAKNRQLTADNRRLERQLRQYESPEKAA
jgi:transcriptional regulator with XRE-family HTH domain